MISQSRIGRYEVVSALGAGAMGAVYKAVDSLTRRTVAIRTIKLDRSKPERTGFEARACREAESAVCLRHANIAAVYEVGEIDDIAYVAMEYVEGASLREMLDSGVVLPVELIASVVARIASALDYAHQNQVLHRDIRPANIVITASREVKIVNFGVAELSAGSHPQLGTLLETPGSPRHMAPEQVAGGNTDGRTDIFALGVVLYEMLSGVVPFDGDDLGAIIDKVLKAEPVPPSTLNSRVPRVFDRIIGRALAKRPRDRYQTALEFACDLQSPDAAPVRKTRRSVTVAVPEKAVQAGRTPVAVRGTALFSPRTVQRGMAVPSAADGKGAAEKAASPLGRARLRRSILLALPIVVIAAFVVVSQGHQARRAELAAVVATPTVPARPAASEPPAVSIKPEVPAEPTVPVMAEVSATPEVSAAPKVPAKPKIAAKPTLPARPAAPASAPGMPESASLPAPVSVTPANATLMLAVSPWGEVYVDGNRVGVTPPLAALELEPGTHHVEIRNQAFAPYRESVNLEPDRSFKVRHKFK